MNKSTIEEKISNWKSQFDKQTQTKLDHTPDSLLVVEKILLSKFDNKEQLLDEANFGFVESSIFYIGEVFRKNDKIRKLEWVFSSSEARTFPILECPYHANSWVDVLKKFPVLLHKKSGTVLHDYFVKNTEYFKENRERLLKNASVLPGKGGFSYQYFILVKDESFELKEIEQALKAYYAKKSSEDKVHFHNESHLLVNMGDDYYFHFQLDTSEGVLQESKEIAENYKGVKDKSVIASCKSRVEFWGDEDPDGDYINDHMILLEQLLQNDKLLIFDFRNGVFFDEF
jgi:hypothetical protein